MPWDEIASGTVKELHTAALEALHYYYRARAGMRQRNSETAVMERHRAALYEIFWRDASRALGADVQCLGNEVFEITKGGKRVRVWRHHTSMDNTIDSMLTINKPVVARVLRELEIPISRFREFNLGDLSPAFEFLGSVANPVVVKPADGTGGGSGVTTNIVNRLALAKAAANARVCGPRAMIEEQIAGDNYRLLYVDGELIDCAIRKPPTLIGDGSSTLKELVLEENRQRIVVGHPRAQVLLSMDLDMVNTLSAQDFKLSSISPEGQVIKVKNVINQNRREDNQTATSQLCPSIVEMGRAVVSTFGSRVMGLDIITTNPGIPLKDSGGVLLEINSPPGLYYHNEEKDGAKLIAVEILRRALS